MLGYMKEPAGYLELGPHVFNLVVLLLQLLPQAPAQCGLQLNAGLCLLADAACIVSGPLFQLQNPALGSASHGRQRVDGVALGPEEVLQLPASCCVFHLSQSS